MASLVLLPTGPGSVETLKTGPFQSFDGAAFLSDGRRIAFSATSPGSAGRIYVLDLPDGKPRPVGPEGASLWPFTSAASPDARLLIGRLPQPGGPGIPILVPVDGAESRTIPDWKIGWPVQWASGGRAPALYLVEGLR
jgi:hypothetical protein